jgi:formyl-CoA transferase/CoA:oxalate CoA-transferase
MLPADLGARVVKVEQPGKGDDTRAWGPPVLGTESAYFLSVNRNKESLTLDFKKPAGRAVLERLVATSDVLVENFRPGTMASLGLDATALTARFPRLVYCSISGFGQTGPRALEPGYDAVMQGEGGLMSITGPTNGSAAAGRRDRRHRDRYVRGAGGHRSALRPRKDGRGQVVDLAMLDSVTALLTYQAGIYFATDTPPGRLGNRHPTIVPYETSRSPGRRVRARSRQR